MTNQFRDDRKVPGQMKEKDERGDYSSKISFQQKGNFSTNVYD